MKKLFAQRFQAQLTKVYDNRYRDITEELIVLLQETGLFFGRNRIFHS